MSEAKERKFKPVDYDPVVDSLFVSVPNRQYEYSIMVGDDLILDFGRLPERNQLDVVGFELLNVSKKFGVEKYALRSIKRLHAEISVNEKVIKLKLSIVVLQHRKERESDKILEVANSGVPPLVSSIAV